MTIIHRLRALLLAAALFSCGQGYPARGESYPSKPITLIIPASKGGGADVSFRVLAQAMEPLLGQKIEILNKPADSGASALTELANAPADGYLLAGAWNGPLTASPQIRKVDYTLDRFEAIAATFDADYVLCTRQDNAAKTAADIVALAARAPLGLTYGTEGKGGSGFFAAEVLFDDLGVLLRNEAFNGSADEADNFMKGKVDLYFGTATAILPWVKAGKAKCLLTLSAQRLPVLPDAAPVSELGVQTQGFSLWRVIIGPKGIPRERMAKLQDVIGKAMDSAQVKTFLAEKNERALALQGPEAMGRLKAEFAAFSKVADRLGLKPE
jgi:tripartite-type tricarboxylate transporter receptor subunit TctC